MKRLQLPAFSPKSIFWFNYLLNKWIRSGSILFYCFFFFLYVNPLFASAGNSGPLAVDTAGIAMLLSRLDPQNPYLENVKSTSSTPSRATVHLLEYYRARLSVRHPVDRSLRTGMKGNYATSADIAIADNALKHIFVGQPAYPPHFCGDDINWGTRPVPDNEWTWQLNRMSFWDAMAKAYWHTGDEKYASDWCNQLTDWVKKNPRDKEHAYAWRSIEAGIRGYRWAGLFQHFLDAPSFTPDVLVAFMNSCYEHAEYLMTKYSSRSNWALMEAEGMAFIAITFPEFREANKWRDEAIRRLNNEINIQVYPDGHQRELAMGYHLGSIGWFLRTYDLALLNGIGHLFPGEYIQSIERMCEVPLKLSHPDGTYPQFGDAWAGRPGQYKKNFFEWANRFNRQDFLYLATDGARGRKPDATAYALKESGLYSMRSGWDANAICLLLKCGPDGGSHSQPDNGTFELSAGGRTLMPDAGSFIYSGDPENRAWFRQTRVHQTLTLDDKNSAYAPRLLLWQPGDSLDILVLENQSYPDLTHRRSIYFVDKKYFVVVDEAYGDAVGNVNLHFQLAPGEALIDLQDLTARTLFEGGWNLQVKTMQQDGLEMIEEEGQVSFLYTKNEARPAFCYRIAKETSAQQVRFVTTVVPYINDVKTHGSASLPVLSVNIVGQHPIGGSGFAIEVSGQGGVKKLRW